MANGEHYQRKSGKNHTDILVSVYAVAAPSLLSLSIFSDVRLAKALTIGSVTMCNDGGLAASQHMGNFLLLLSAKPCINQIGTLLM